MLQKVLNIEQSNDALIAAPYKQSMFHFSRVVPRFNCQLSSVSARRLSVKDRILDVHGDICEIGGGRADVQRNGCSIEHFGKSLNDGNVMITFLIESGEFCDLCIESRNILI